jgi:RNA-directed DNA polymerase
MPREQSKWAVPTRGRVPTQGTGTESPVGVWKVREWGWSEGVTVSGFLRGSTPRGRTLVEKAKPFSISTREVWEASKRVKANQGAAGGEGQAMTEVESDRATNLSKLWKRLASGSDVPPPVRRVAIPKGEGRTRPLGMPPVADRRAQMVVQR